jgi:regulator of sigma E protease
MSIFGSALIGFLIAVAILVTVHEFGHYLVARWCGVKVIRFSVGFGPVLLRWIGKRGLFKGDEFVVSAIPLGGYVRMLDTRDEEFPPKDASEAATAFDRQVLWKRSLIVAAGPLANFLLAILLYAAALAMPERSPAAVLGSPRAETAAAVADVRGGETVKQIAGRDVFNWDDVRWQLLVHMFDERLSMTLVDGGIERQVELTRSAEGASGDVTAKRLTSWGIGIFQPAVIGSVVAGGPAAAAGLVANDRVVAVDGKRVNEWGELTQLIQAAPNRVLTLQVVRDAASPPLSISVRPKAVAVGERSIGRIDVTPANLLASKDTEIAEGKRGVGAAALEGVLRTLDATSLTARVLWGMVTGEVSLRQVSGPLSMAEGAGATLKQGFTAFLLFLAIVSISIGVLNLLPVPMLDGGQLLYHLYEAIKGSPPSERALVFGQRIGIGFVTSLTALALYNDFHRIFS